MSGCHCHLTNMRTSFKENMANPLGMLVNHYHIKQHICEKSDLSTKHIVFPRIQFPLPCGRHIIDLYWRQIIYCMADFPNLCQFNRTNGFQTPLTTVAITKNPTANIVLWVSYILLPSISLC